MLDSGEGNPMEYKKELAYEIVRFYDGEEAAQQAQNHFEKVVQRQDLPDEIVTLHTASNISISELFDILKRTNLVKSKADAKRLMDQGGIKMGDEILKTDDLAANIEIPSTSEGLVIKVGKRRFVRLSNQK